MVGVLLRISERALGGLRGNVNHVSLVSKFLSRYTRIRDSQYHLHELKR